MSANIVRKPHMATGGITDAEREQMATLVKEWTAISFRTKPIDHPKITAAIKGIYAAAKLKEPRVVIVPSPLVMAFAYGAAAAIWYQRKGGKKYTATTATTDDATRDATDVATDAATADTAAPAAAADGAPAGILATEKIVTDV